MSKFDAKTLSDLHEADEVAIRTEKHPDSAVVIWVVVADEEAFVRSFRGAKGRWYRDLATGGPAVLEFGCREVVPRLERTPDEVHRILHALDGGYVPAGPSCSPTRGLVNVLPTGRNFYSVDPKAIPSVSAWEVGSTLAESLVERILFLEGTPNFQRLGNVLVGETVPEQLATDLAFKMYLPPGRIDVLGSFVAGVFSGEGARGASTLPTSSGRQRFWPVLPTGPAW